MLGQDRILLDGHHPVFARAGSIEALEEEGPQVHVAIASNNAISAGDP